MDDQLPLGASDVVIQPLVGRENGAYVCRDPTPASGGGRASCLRVPCPVASVVWESSHTSTGLSCGTVAPASGRIGWNPASIMPGYLSGGTGPTCLKYEKLYNKYLYNLRVTPVSRPILHSPLSALSEYVKYLNIKIVHYTAHRLPRWCTLHTTCIVGLQGSVRVEEKAECEGNHRQPRQFAVVLNHLFATRLAPEGRPYTLTEVSKATGMSVPYLSILRKGTINAVPFHRVEALARFFHIPLDYFSQVGPPVDTLDDLVREALAQPLVREVALRAGKVGLAQRALVLQMLNHAEQVLQELAATRHNAESEGNTSSCADRPAPQEA